MVPIINEFNIVYLDNPITNKFNIAYLDNQCYLQLDC